MPYLILLPDPGTPQEGSAAISKTPPNPSLAHRVPPSNSSLLDNGSASSLVSLLPPRSQHPRGFHLIWEATHLPSCGPPSADSEPLPPSWPGLTAPAYFTFLQCLVLFPAPGTLSPMASHFLLASHHGLSAEIEASDVTLPSTCQPPGLIAFIHFLPYCLFPAMAGSPTSRGLGPFVHVAMP